MWSTLSYLVKSRCININERPFNPLLVIVDLSSFFKKRSVLIDLSQVALVTGRVAPIHKRTNKLGKVDLSRTAKALGRVLISFALLLFFHFKYQACISMSKA